MVDFEQVPSSGLRTRSSILRILQERPECLFKSEGRLLIALLPAAGGPRQGEETAQQVREEIAGVIGAHLLAPAAWRGTVG